MRTYSFFSAVLLASAAVAGCVEASDEVLDETALEPESLEDVEQAATDPSFRVYNVASLVLPAANYDGVAGTECIAFINPEHRLRNIILVTSVNANGSCALTPYSANSAFSFTWGDTTPYSGAAGIAALRSIVGDGDAAVHRLTGVITNEAAAYAALQAFLTLPNATQATQIASFASNRVHSLYDFDGQEEVYAEAAYQAVRVTQSCENPGSPGLYAHVNAGFVYGYIASNTGSCHSGWFQRRHTYNRNWTQVARYDYSE
jgi:hypothetical protein